MDRPRIGFVTCVHPVYDLPEVRQYRERAVAGLREAGCDLLVPAIPRNSLEAIEVAGELRQGEIDLLLLFFCTWVAEEIPLTIVRELFDLPLLLWSLPYLQRDLPIPSPITGLTTSGCNLRRLGKAYHYLIGPVVPEKVREATRVAEVAAVLRELRRSRFGLVGYPCPGMIDATADESLIQKVLGSTAIHLDLDGLLASAAEASGEEAAALARDLVSRTGGLEGLELERVVENFRLYLGMRSLADRNGLDAFCVRCWPELRDRYRVTICLALSRLAEEGMVSVCEVDLAALITAFILHRLARSATYCFDITGYLEEGALQLAHCGSAALSLAADPKKAKIRGHMRTGAGAMLEFGFKGGAVTLAKLLRPLDNRMKLFFARGEAIPTPETVRGAVATVRVEPSPATFLDKMLREGVEHHPVLVYGDWTVDLSLFCKLSGLEPLTP